MSSYIQDKHIAKHYANILYDLAKQSGDVTQVHSELQVMGELYENDDDFADFCNNPTTSRTQAVEVIAQVASQAGFCPLVTNLLQAMAQNNRLQLIGSVEKYFIDLERKDKGEIVIELTSAHALSLEQRNLIQSNISTAFNAPVILELREDETLIAGLKIKYGSHELDASASGRLRAAGEQLAVAINHSERLQH